MATTLLANRSELDDLRQVVRAFAQGDIAPLVDEAESSGHYPLQLFPRAGELGFIGTHYRVEDGGGGGGLLSAMVIREEISYVSVGISSGLGHQDHVGTA